MRERRFLQGTICLVVLLCFTGIFVSVWTAKYSVKRFQTIVGNLYQEEPEKADQFLKSAFEAELSEETLAAGEKAVVKLGYTEVAYDILYEKFFPENGQIICVFFMVLLSVGICVLVGLRRREAMNRVRGICRRIQESEEFGQDFQVVRNADGEWISLEYEIAKVVEANRKRKRYFEKRQEQMQLFMENLAHQIKTPIACILLNLELLQDREEELFTIENTELCEQKTRSNLQLLEDSVNQGEKIRTLLKRLLNLARMEAGKVHFLKEQVPLGDILYEIQSEFPEGKVVLELAEGKENLEEVLLLGDRQWLYEAVFNLVDNSVKYAKSESIVKLEVEIHRENIRLVVQDFGKGIAKERLEQLFERYYVGESSDEFQTGIGLNLTKQIVVGHHGRIRVESVEGKGTKMEITLPRLKWKEKVSV